MDVINHSAVMCYHLTEAPSLTFYQAFAVETQRGCSEKWTLCPTDFIEYPLEVNPSFLQQR